MVLYLKAPPTTDANNKANPQPRNSPMRPMRLNAFAVALRIAAVVQGLAAVMLLGHAVIGG